MITPADVARWTAEAAPALRGGLVHRVWRDDEAWVLLVRHHEEGDPERPVARRVALEVALAAEFARAVALPPEAVGADEPRSTKKAQARDAHPFLSLLRRHLVGGRVLDYGQPLAGERLALFECRQEPVEADEDGPGLPGRRLQLAIELLGRSPNLVLAAVTDDDPAGRPRVLGSLHPGKGARPLEPGALYHLPSPRPGPDQPPAPALAGEVAPDPERLAVGQAVAALQRAAEEEARPRVAAGALVRAARQALKRVEGIQHKLELQLQESRQADAWEHEADLLKANLDRIPRGAERVEVTDWVDGVERQVELRLDPAEAPRDRMQALYKKAKKLRRGETSVGTRLGETDRQLAELRAVVERLEQTAPEDEAALDALEVELRKLGGLPKEKEARPRVQENQGPRSFRSLEGHEILVGRSDEENDRLTMQLARGNDLFFHVRGCPGSHVILRVDPKRPPNHETLLDCAALAQHFSKARQRPKVDVSYTPRKWVKKPRGAKPGLVQISNERTIHVAPDPPRLARLMSTLNRSEED